ncbi:hypothetical protein [Bosea sp. BIWAKO-01]|uniref:hypothetical protein n=1 Tax=Bosea sp. BIWAKO-01 TaxID=506668 RepID=UPI0008534027|nr:hypothetical protein [Bosea sp. BIWAKO-01]GAU81468.1 hypothetical protein BIWAKO_01362 [Bosea sp. BIWAKO-01]
MNTGGFTETIWHFAGYLRVFVDEVRAREIYDGETSRVGADEGNDRFYDRTPPVAADETISQSVLFQARNVIEDSPALHSPAPTPFTPPAKILPSSHPFPHRLDAPDSVDYDYGYAVTNHRIITVGYQGGGTETLLSIHQVNQADDRDLLTSDAIHYPDGTLVVPPELHLDGVLDSMLHQAENAVPREVAVLQGGTTQSVIEAIESRDSRWAETGSPYSDGSPVSHAVEGRTVDGALNSGDPSVPSIAEVAPWRLAEEAPADSITKSISAAEPTGGVAVISETGMNTLANAAVIVDANEATGSMIVGGNYFFSRGIAQVNVLVDNDHVDVAVDGALTPLVQTHGNEVHNIAEFATNTMTIAPNGAAATPFWSVDVMPGSFYDVKSVVQFNGLNDSDRIVQAENGTYFDVKSGENAQLNLALLTGLDSYDIIIIGGDYHRADWIYQYNIVLDPDSAKLFATGHSSDSTVVTTGFNNLTNLASITTYDSAAFKPMLQAHYDLIDALDRHYTILTPNTDWELNGNRSGTLHVLYVPGDYYDVNVITQINVLNDADQVIQANAQPGTTQGVAAGANTVLNEAHIIDPGTLSASKYLGGQAYEESVLIQTNMITDTDKVTIHDTQTLVPELVAFAHDVDSHSGSDSSGSRPVIPDPSQHDHLTSNIMT